MYELGQVLCSSRVSVALLQEPYTRDGIVRGLPGRTRVFTDENGDSAVIVFDRDIDCTMVSRSQWGVCVRIEGGFGKMFVASIYCRFSVTLDPYLEYMNTVLLLVSSNPLIIALDANASSPMWYSKVAGRSTSYRNLMRGQMLSEWMLSVGLDALNESSDLYTFDGPNGASDIDVTAANGAATTAYDFRWGICDSWGVSDHRPIRIDVAFHQRTREPEQPRKWRDNAVDWGYYSECIRAAAMPLEDFRQLTIDEQISKIDQWMCTVNDVQLGRRRQAKPSKVPWWTRELDTMRRSVRRLRKQFQSARRANAENLTQRKADYFALLRTYKDRLAVEKDTNWRRFVLDHRDDPWGTVYRVCRGTGRVTDISSFQAGIETLLTNFFPEAERVGDIPPLVEITDPPPLDRSEVDECMCQIRCRKSPGMDGMTGRMLKAIWIGIPEYIESIFESCIRSNYFPSAWKMARVVVLLKAPDRDRSNPRSYRGISLLPVLAKALERIMVARLLESYSIGFSAEQFGFRKGRSVEDAWLHVSSLVSQSTAKYVLGIFVDFKGAFDYLSWDSVLTRLAEVGCRELGLWRSYFSDRRACVVGASDVVCRSVARGCPQGSICGPYIWNLMMDTLLRSLSASYKLCAYADDLLILVEGQSRAELERKSEEAMRMTSEWGSRVGVEVAFDKTSTMLLKGTLSHNRPPFIRSGGVSIRFVSQVKYLGIVVAERMNFLVHFRYVKDKLSAIAGKIKRILRSDWGLGRRAVRTIYGGLFVACATFGAPVWYRAVLTAEGSRRIQSCQRLALLACLPVCRTVSTDALQVLLGAAPLDLEVIRRAIAFKIKKGLPLSQVDWISESDLTGDHRRNKELLDECLVSRWQTRWTMSLNGRVTYAFIKDVTFVRDRPDFGFGLSLGYLLTGHGSLNAFLHKRALSDTPDCGCGRGPEDYLHILTQCLCYDDIRDLTRMGIFYTQDGWDVSRAVENESTLAALSSFAREVFYRRRTRLSGGNSLT